MSVELKPASIAEQEFAEQTASKEQDHLRELLVVGHTYQPPREPYIPSTKGGLELLSWVNAEINEQVYQPVFENADGVPHILTSYYAPLRDWKMQHTPEGFQKARENINAMADKEYQIMGDPYMHVILPLQSEQDQDMLVKIGKQAFKDDLGFEPKGFWPPETAIDAVTARVLYKNGYEFVTLRDDQVSSQDRNPVYVPIRDEKGKVIGELAVVHFNSSLSGGVSYQDHFTENGDRFLADQRQWNPGNIAIGSDTELYGHHKKNRDQFLRYITQSDVLNKNGYKAFDVKTHLTDPSRIYGELRDSSSWSCPHRLGRWKGECDCDHPTSEALQDKREFYGKLTHYGHLINVGLDSADPNWRDQFTTFFLGVRKPWFGRGDVDNAVRVMIDEDRNGLSILGDERMKYLFTAKMCELVGKTSCGWFFPDINAPERALPKTMIGEIERALPGIEDYSAELQAADD